MADGAQGEQNKGRTIMKRKAMAWVTMGGVTGGHSVLSKTSNCLAVYPEVHLVLRGLSTRLCVNFTD